MSDFVSKLFNKHLIQEMDGDDSVFGRDRRNREADAFNSSTDSDTPEGAFDSEGLGVDVDAEEERVFIEVLGSLERYKNMNDEMLGTLEKLSQIDKNDSIANGLTDPLRKVVEKARNNIYEMVNKIEVTNAVSEKIKQKIASLRSR